jgi:regulatory protein
VKSFQKALNYSFLLLKYRARSSSEIISRLKRKKYSISLIEKVVNYLQENNYLNDEDFTRLFVAWSLEKGWGPKRIDFSLKELGIPLKLRQASINKIDCRQVIREIIKLKKPINLKVIRSLEAKGFDPEDIVAEVERFKNDDHSQIT